MRVVHKHEPVDLYGTVIALPRLTWPRRAMWWVLLTLARHDWGQALIRWARGL